MQPLSPEPPSAGSSPPNLVRRPLSFVHRPSQHARCRGPWSPGLQPLRRSHRPIPPLQDRANPARSPWLAHNQFVRSPRSRPARARVQPMLHPPPSPRRPPRRKPRRPLRKPLRKPSPPSPSRCPYVVSSCPKPAPGRPMSPPRVPPTRRVGLSLNGPVPQVPAADRVDPVVPATSPADQEALAVLRVPVAVPCWLPALAGPCTPPAPSQAVPAAQVVPAVRVLVPVLVPVPASALARAWAVVPAQADLVVSCHRRKALPRPIARFATRVAPAAEPRATKKTRK